MMQARSLTVVSPRLPPLFPQVANSAHAQISVSAMRPFLWPGSTMKREGDIHIGGDIKVAWFKDPDGNILNVVSG
jgi:hypothetical protein